ncbi:hypothetical protein OED01_10120 [Microbacterium sp. M28]|uniref:hypothetical protein n=1 Tax=Microbacterium sp. M28 TaxID=2962064 RepID=UPI0021F43687|nr:hypothetical protein [Microbacterium sp. M28]UYO95964.1 hypothetical protein OED01_10120 [Microbacterium sp. M28]
MSDPHALPDDQRRVNADGLDPDIPTTDDRPDPDDTSPAEEDADEDTIEVEDLP